MKIICSLDIHGIEWNHNLILSVTHSLSLIISYESIDTGAIIFRCCFYLTEHDCREGNKERGKQITLKENKLLFLCQAFSILTILFDDVKNSGFDIAIGYLSIYVSICGFNTFYIIGSLG